MEPSHVAPPPHAGATDRVALVIAMNAATNVMRDAQRAARIMKRFDSLTWL